MRPRSRVVLLVIAAALLTFGLSGPIKRAWESRSQAEAKRQLMEQVEKDRAAAREEFKARRDEILARLRSQLAAGDYAAAMTGAGRYASVDDAELRDLYRSAARAESMRQRTGIYTQLVARDCTEQNARAEIARLLGEEKDAPHRVVDVSMPDLRLARVAADEAQRRVRARMQEPVAEEPHERPGEPAAAHAMPFPPDADWATRMRALNRARLLPDYVAALNTSAVDALLCVWRANGSGRLDGKPVELTLDVWLAPTPDGKALRGDPVAYSTESR